VPPTTSPTPRRRPRPHLDATVVLDREIVELGIYPAVTRSRRRADFDAQYLGERH